jgi:hypothetical protein
MFKSVDQKDIVFGLDIQDAKDSGSSNQPSFLLSLNPQLILFRD